MERAYPAWWIEQSEDRRLRLQAAVERLRAAIRRDPDVVGALVFGSYATGKVGPQSDLDVMLVVHGVGPLDLATRFGRYHERLRLGVPCDLLVYDEREFEAVKARSFGARAFGEGFWIDAT